MFKAVRLNAITYPVESGESDELARVGSEFVAIEGQHPDEILEAAADCDALLVVAAYVPGSVIDRLTRCKVISRLGAGTDRIDVEAATQAGIVVANVPDFCMNEQAEHTMALLLASARQLPYMSAAMRRGEWTARSHPEVHRVAGQTLTLLGFGSSAQAVATRASAFGLKLVAWVRNPAKYERVAYEHHVELLPLEQAIGAADFLSIHLPLNDET